MNFVIDYPTYVEVDASEGVATLNIADSNGKEFKFVISAGLPVGKLFFGTEEEYLARLDESWAAA